MPPDCVHKPPCPVLVSRWACGQRTSAEAAVKRGLIKRESAERLLAKYGVSLTPISLVYKGQKPETREPITETLFRNEDE